jgi:hypothetical protein
MSSIWTFANATAIAGIVSMDRCIAIFGKKQIKADRAEL